VTLDKPHILLSYLSLFAWQRALAGLACREQHTSSALHDVDALTGGTGLTMPALSLRLLHEYFRSPTAEAAAAVAEEREARQEDLELWQPLIRPSFAEGLWQQLLAVWRSAGCFAGSAPAAESQSESMLARYAAMGRFPRATPWQGDSWRLGLFGSFLAAMDIPPGGDLQQLARAASSALPRGDASAAQIAFSAAAAASGIGILAEGVLASSEAVGATANNPRRA